MICIKDKFKYKQKYYLITFVTFSILIGINIISIYFIILNPVIHFHSFVITFLLGLLFLFSFSSSLYGISASIKNPGYMTLSLTSKSIKKSNVNSIIKGKTFTLKYCHTCNLVRSPSASHCKYCDVCIERYDHHCPWIGNCIGEYNYKDFYIFIVLLMMNMTYIFCISLYKAMIIMNINDYTYVFNICIVVSCISISISILLLILIAYHSYFICFNITTYINSKQGLQIFLYGEELYSKGGILKNILYIFKKKEYKIRNNRQSYLSNDNISVKNSVNLYNFDVVNNSDWGLLNNIRQRGSFVVGRSMEESSYNKNQYNSKGNGNHEVVNGNLLTINK